MQASGPRLSQAARAVRTSVFASLQARIDAFRREGGELIPLQIGDTHLAPPLAAIAVGRDFDPRVLSTYGAVSGLPELREALAARLAGNGHTSVRSADDVHVGAGCTHALFCAVRAVLDPGDEVLVVTPHWPLITGLLSAAGAVPVEVPLTQDLFARRSVDLAQVLRSHASERTRAVYLSSPNNPDGYVFTGEELEAIGRLAKERSWWLFADEVYADFVYDGRHTPMASLPGMAERTITGHSLSKSHALAGARIGYVSAPPAVIDAVRRISNHTVYNVPVLMQHAALAALESDQEFLTAARSIHREARDATSAALVRHGLVHRIPSGGSFVFVDLASRLGTSSVQRALELAVDRGVLVAPGDAFGAAHASCVRLCFTGVRQEDVLRGVERLASALDALAQESR